MKSISKFQSGQVFEIVYRDLERGGFTSNESSKSLIYIINKLVYINDKQHVLTFFKDITFGVLYEQIKA